MRLNLLIYLKRLLRDTNFEFKGKHSQFHTAPFHFVKNSYFKFLQGSVARLFSWSWKILSYSVANLSKTLHINFYQNQSSIVEVMIQKFWCVFCAPQCNFWERCWRTDGPISRGSRCAQRRKYYGEIDKRRQRRRGVSWRQYTAAPPLPLLLLLLLLLGVSCDATLLGQERRGTAVKSGRTSLSPDVVDPRQRLTWSADVKGPTVCWNVATLRYSIASLNNVLCGYAGCWRTGMSLFPSLTSNPGKTQVNDSTKYYRNTRKLLFIVWPWFSFCDHGYPDHTPRAGWVLFNYLLINCCWYSQNSAAEVHYRLHFEWVGPYSQRPRAAQWPLWPWS